MIRNQTDLIDPLAPNTMSDAEREIVADAGRVGNSPNSAGATNTTDAVETGGGRGHGNAGSTELANQVGATRRTTIPGEIAANDAEEPGNDTDVGGADETAEMAANIREHNAPTIPND